MQDIVEVENLPVSRTTDQSSIIKFVTFWIHDELFGVDILDVKEVTPVMKITPIFHAPDEVRGYVNIRGEIHLVINLRFLLDLPQHEITAETRIVIFKPTIAEPFGILVDRVGDVLEVDSGSIEPEIKSNSKKTKNQHTRRNGIKYSNNYPYDSKTINN